MLLYLALCAALVVTDSPERRVRTEAEPEKLYTKVAAVAGNLNSKCSWWSGHGDTAKFAQFGELCGLGSQPGDVDAYIEDVWANVVAARAEVEARADATTLRVYLGPEWTFRRYGRNGRPLPLSARELEYLLSQLEQRLATGWEDWLVVPGSIYWGLNGLPGAFAHATGKPRAHAKHGYTEKSFAIFNTVPVFAAGRLVTVHNKWHSADNLLPDQDVWGNEVLDHLAEAAGTDRPQAAQKWLSFLQQRDPAEAEVVKTRGLVFSDALVVFGGRLIGLDVCMDHATPDRAASAGLARAQIDQYDVQLLLSSGMDFSIPETPEYGGYIGPTLRLRQGGVAVQSDSTSFGARLVQAKVGAVPAEEHAPRAQDPKRLIADPSHNGGKLEYLSTKAGAHFANHTAAGRQFGAWPKDCSGLRDRELARCRKARAACRARQLPDDYCPPTRELGNHRLFTTFPVQAFGTEVQTAKLQLALLNRASQVAPSSHSGLEDLNEVVWVGRRPAANRFSVDSGFHEEASRLAAPRVLPAAKAAKASGVTAVRREAKSVEGLQEAEDADEHPVCAEHSEDLALSCCAILSLLPASGEPTNEVLHHLCPRMCGPYVSGCGGDQQAGVLPVPDHPSCGLVDDCCGAYHVDDRDWTGRELCPNRCRGIFC